jgi:hypothetical protein
MIDRITGLSLSALVPSLVVIALAAGPSPSQAVDQPGDRPGDRTAAAASSTPPAASSLALDDATIAQIVPALPQIINLAILDPQLASQLVPDSWLDSAIESARIVAGEKPRAQHGPTAPASWPVGPWSSASSMASSISDLDPAAAAALFRALRPRIAQRCQMSGAVAARCEQEMRVTLERLGSPVVAERLAGRDASPITDSQLEFARLGPQIVHPGRAKIAALHRAAWPANP